MHTPILSQIQTLLIASNNKGKVIEIAQLLAPLGITVKSATEYNIAEPHETAADFIGNARLKAKYYGDIAQLPALADDSGLCVDALDGDPGIYSARWAGPNKDFMHAMNTIEQKLKAKNLVSSSAHFTCALSLYLPNNNGGSFIDVEGFVNGKLTFPARGEHGFGYDPIFIPTGHNQTFAQMDASLKYTLSHRTDAFKKLLGKLS